MQTMMMKVLLCFRFAIFGRWLFLWIILGLLQINIFILLSFILPIPNIIQLDHTLNAYYGFKIVYILFYITLKG